jgi:hypothetical protein
VEPHYLSIAVQRQGLVIHGPMESGAPHQASTAQHSTALQHREKGKGEHKVAITSRKWDGTSLSPALPATAAGL